MNSPALKYAAFALLAIVTIVTRIHYFDRSLWLDESWVANSILTPSYRAMFFYEYWIQTTPPLLLISERLWVAIVGASNWAFRTVPFLLGAGAVFLLTRFVTKTLQLSLGLLCGLLAAVSTGVQFSKDLKQYSGEMFFGALFLNLALDLPPLGFTRRTAILCGAIVLAAGFGFPSLAYLPVVLMAILLQSQEKRFVTVALGALTAAISLGLLYLIYMKPNSSESLMWTWAGLFPRSLDPFHLATFYFQGLKAMFLQHLWPGLVRVDLARQLVLALGLIGLMRGVAALRRPSPEALVFLGAALPIAGAVAANVAGLYPFWYERFSHYLLPTVLLLITLGVHTIASLARRPVPLLLPLILLVGAAVLAFDPARWPPRTFEQIEDALAHMDRAGATKADLLYVHTSVVEPMRLYRRMRKWERVETWYGGTGTACCPRDLDRVRMLEDPLFLRQDFDRFFAATVARRIWMLYTGRPDHWEFVKRNEEEIHARWLSEAGCQRESAHQFPKISLASWRCPVR